MLRSINPSFPGLFSTKRKVVYVFRTRLPVAINCIATVMLPHDLHVLSLPLAFILSQDQTLHCKCCLILTLLIQRINVVKSNVIRLTYLASRRRQNRIGIAVASQLSKIFWPFASARNARGRVVDPPFLWECKCTSRMIPNQNFLQVFG